MVKKGLGKGLGALINDVMEDEIGSIQEIEIKKILANEDQPRKTFNDESIEELARSIEENGLISPIIVKREADKFRIVAGERRYRAVKLLGYDKIDAIVRDLEDFESKKLAIIENIQREDLNPMEEANAYKVIMEEYSMTQEELAKSLGKSRSHIANLLRFTSLPEPIQESIREGNITRGHAKVLAGVKDGESQVKIAKKIEKNRLSVKDVEDIVKSSKEEPVRKTSKQNYFLNDIENKLADKLGVKVEIKGSEFNGKVSIDYYSKEDLEGIIELLIRG